MKVLRRCKSLLLLSVMGCTPDAPAPEPVSGAPATAAAANGWRTNPADGVRLSGGRRFRIETGPHALAVPADGRAWAPPYNLQATLQKRRGRLHEGFGLVFGGENLHAPEDRQVYSYFLVRGDGSFLIKKREGGSTAVVRDWTHHAAVPRDTEEGGQPVELRVAVDSGTVRFEVDGQEVAEVAAAELRTHGQAGLRIAHGVQLTVENFRITQGD